MAKRHLTPAEIDHVAQRAHLGPQRRAALATTRVPADAPTAKLVDVLVDIERTLIALGRHLGPPRVCEIRRHGAGGAADIEARGTGPRRGSVWLVPSPSVRRNW